MAVLDELSGFEFEDVFRNLGYDDVRQASKPADEGRDILMEEVVDGRRRGVVVECKHTDNVGRPVLQKLHSAVSTFDYEGPKRGMIVTTGRFTDPAREYAARLEQTDDPYPIELVDGQGLRRIAEEVGLDLYNGRIEILCEETLRPYDPAGDIETPVTETFRTIENLRRDEIPPPTARAMFEPVVVIEARTNAVFETSVGVIHRINETNSLVVRANRSHPNVLNGDVSQLLTDNLRRTVDLDEDAFRSEFDEIEVNRFGQTETEYKDWAIGQLQNYHTTQVSYTGDNNVTYNKTCKPKQSEITVQSITPVYLPEIHLETRLQEHSYAYEYYAAGPSRVTSKNGIQRCVQCAKQGAKTYTYCRNCGSINCGRHIKTERLEETPVCTGCAVTGRFAFKTTYFYNEHNLREFEVHYTGLPIHEKAMENKPLTGGVVAGVILTMMWILLSVGIL